jgi:hypothetical protein
MPEDHILGMVYMNQYTNKMNREDIRPCAAANPGGSGASPGGSLLAHEATSPSTILLLLSVPEHWLGAGYGISAAHMGEI